jgi:hypothetical protein
MCIEVAISAQAIEHTFWAPDALAIYIPSTATLTAVLPEIRAILNDLSAPMTGDLTCHCGEPINLPTDLEVHSGTPTHQQPAAAAE